MMTRTAIFIEPDGPLLAMVRLWKSRVEKDLPEQPYCAHPPHCTLYVSTLKPVEDLHGILSRELARIAPFEIRVSHTMAFFDDMQTGGGHTLAFRVDECASLVTLQAAAANALKPFVDWSVLSSQCSYPHDSLLSASLSEFGFPFVGKHWIPHFSVASLKVARDHALVREFLALRFSATMRVDRVSMWAISGEYHERTGVLTLGGNRQ